MNQKQEILVKLRSILNDLKAEYSRILIFGSRARGDFREESDWDFFIILKKPLDARRKKV